MSSRLGRLVTSVALAATLVGGAVATTATPALASTSCTKLVVSVVCTGDISVNILNVDALNNNKISVSALNNILNNAFNNNKTDLEILSDIQVYLKDINVANCLITVNVLSPVGCLAL